MPSKSWELACFSVFASSPLAICCMRKKPSTVTTNADTASVVPTTRSCSDRCHRSRIAPATALPQPRGLVPSRRVSRHDLIPPVAFPRLPGVSARSRPVSDAAHRHHDLRVLGILLDLGAQPLHAH